MSTDAIVLLRQDHAALRKLFRQFQQAKADDLETKGQVVDQLIELLTVHTYLENELVYPRVRELLPELEDDILESYEEHHVADLLVLELAALKPDSERFTAKATVLIESVKHHMTEEEEDWFPQVRAGLGRTALQELGAELVQLRSQAPTRPSQPSALKKSLHSVRS